MSTTTMTPASMPPRGGHWRDEHGEAPAPMAWVLRALDAIDAWCSRARSRRALLELSDAGLKDIGLSRADARQEGSKPFWRP